MIKVTEAAARERERMGPTPNAAGKDAPWSAEDLAKSAANAAAAERNINNGQNNG